jgi:hypothetical protein
MTKSLQLANHYGLRAGDRIMAPKSMLDMVQHHALFWGYDAHGHAWVVENLVNVGVTYTRFDHFMLRVRSINRIARFRGDRWALQQVLRRAHAYVGRRYDLATYNCEHFVNEVLHGQRHSWQVETARGVLKGAFAIAVLAFIVRAA